MALLYGRPEESFYLREFVSLLKTGVGAVQRELCLLQEMGILEKTKRGHQSHFRANPDSPIYSELRGIVQKMDGWAPVLKQALWPLKESITTAFVYGSHASHTQTFQSDVDLFVVGNLDEMALHRAVTKAEEGTRKAIHYSLFTPEEFGRRKKEKEGFVARVLQGPKIPILGEEK